MERKVINDAVAYLRSLAELRGRNADWAEKAVRDAATLTATAALQERVIDIDRQGRRGPPVPDRRPNGRRRRRARCGSRPRAAAIVELKPDWKMQVMSAIADPNIALILLMIGIYGILFEFWTPGVVAPGVVGGISLLVALAALSVLPVNYAGLALLLFGIGLMVAEAFSPEFRSLGPGRHCRLRARRPVPVRSRAVGHSDQGLLAGGGRPDRRERRLLRRHSRLCVRARRRPVRTGSEEMIGSTGEVVSWTGDEGRVQVHGEIWAARSGHGLAKGQKVRVVGRTGLTLAVEPST